MSAEHESSENIPRDQEVEERFGTINAALRDIVADHVKDLPKDVGDDLWTKVNSLTETGAIDITEVFERANGIELEVQLREAFAIIDENRKQERIKRWQNRRRKLVSGVMRLVRNQPKDTI